MSFRDDGEEFATIRNAMKVLEMTDQEIWDILKVTSCNRFSFEISFKLNEFPFFVVKTDLLCVKGSFLFNVIRCFGVPVL